VSAMPKMSIFKEGTVCLPRATFIFWAWRFILDSQVAYST